MFIEKYRNTKSEAFSLLIRTCVVGDAGQSPLDGYLTDVANEELDVELEINNFLNLSKHEQLGEFIFKVIVQAFSARAEQ